QCARAADWIRWNTPSLNIATVPQHLVSSVAEKQTHVQTITVHCCIGSGVREIRNQVIRDMLSRVFGVSADEVCVLTLRSKLTDGRPVSENRIRRRDTDIA